ncbi:hypothetical protein [Zunongwangia endophytica]|nr:hypothetical protein [Zunongwangia endophytica]MDN3593282.1 hypothetical protein [Zunongwangia endophytica]
MKVSKAIYKVCGYDHREVMKKEFRYWWNENIHPEDRLHVIDKLKK